MITWISIGWLLALPTVLVGAVAALPTLRLHTHLVGGGPVRQWLLNHCVVPLLPHDAAVAAVAWFAQASYFGEWSLAALVAVNLNAVMLLPLYFFCAWLIRLSGWIAASDLEQKRRNVRR